MDSLLVIGSKDTKLTGFLKKMGYAIHEFEGQPGLAEMIDRHLLDVILVDTRIDLNGVDLCQFLRSHDSTKQVPIVCISDRPRVRYDIKELGLDRVEIFEAPYQIGKVVSAIAMQVRMTKNAGKDDRTASLMEANAALRDLNTRFQKELHEARSIQESLLPQELPQDSRFSVSIAYQPLEEVGGDWYYLEACPSGSIGIHIADVTGHGLGAAFVGSMTKLALSAAGERQPHKLLGEMNRLMAPQLPPGRFVTMGSYLYNPATGEVAASRAGHPPALHLKRKTGEICELRGEGFPIGFFPDADYTMDSATLEPGDLFIAVTDGITEMQNRGFETYGQTRLSESLLRIPPETPVDGIRDAILKDVHEFREGRIVKDDITLIVLRREL